MENHELDQEIRRLRQEGWSFQAIQKELSVSRGRIDQALSEADPPQQEHPDEDLDARVARHVNSAIDEKVLPALDKIREQQSADMQSLFQRIPNEEQVVSRVIDQLKAEAEEAARQHLERDPEPQPASNAVGPTGLGNGYHAEPPGNLDWANARVTDETEMAAINDLLEQAKSKETGSGITKRDIIELLQMGLPLIDWTMNTGFRWKMMQQQLTDPFAYMRNLYSNEPEKAHFLVTTWANQGNPLAAQIPGMLARAWMEGLSAKGAALKAITGGVDTAPGSSPANPLVNPYVGPSATQASPWPGGNNPSGAATRDSGSGPTSRSESVNLNNKSASFAASAVRSR